MSTKTEKPTILASFPHLADEVSLRSSIFFSHSGPLAFIQYNFVSEDDNVEFSIGL